MIITREEQANILSYYAKDKTTAELLAFGDGLDVMFELISSKQHINEVDLLKAVNHWSMVEIDINDITNFLK